MRCTSRQRGADGVAAGIPAGMLMLCALAAGLLPAAPARGQTPAGDKPGIRVVGPLAAKEMTEALAAEFAQSKKAPVAVEYSRCDLPAYAANGLLAGSDVALAFGGVTDKDLGQTAGRWKALGPEEHVLAACAAAIVVHARCPAESLTAEQLRTIFSGEAKDWSVFGGPRTAIRRYGLAFGDPVTVLFHDKVLSAARCGLIGRKKDSDEVLAAVTGDPAAIGFMDAAAATSAGETVKVIAIGDGKAAVAPNVQTIKDGTYPLAETLMLYVSPKASEAAKGFARFILEGGGDAVLRKHGFIPALRAVRVDVLAAFEKLYGPDIERVKATPDAADDLALAEQIMRTARSAKLEDDLLAAMCEAAHDLAANPSGGKTLAFEALNVLSARVPDQRFDCAVRRAALVEGVYKEGKSPADGEHLVEALMSAAEMGTSARRFAEAADAWKKALAVAEELDSPKLASIRQRGEAFEARREALAEAASLAARLARDPKDVEAKMKLFWAQLVNLDNPAEAMRYVDVVDAEEFKTFVPLASRSLEELTEESALKLANWYVEMVDWANVGGKELMTARARECYLRFFALHKDRQDELAMQAALGIQKVGGKAPDPPAQAQPGKKPPAPAVTAGLKPGEEMTDLRLAEFVAAHPDLTRLGAQEIGSARRITDLRPLERLTKLATLELQQAGNVRDLSPLAKLTNLTTLTLTGLEADSISALSGLPRLTTLNVSGAGNVADIAPIGRLLSLKTLNLSGCVKVQDLAPISRLTGLTALNLSGCEAVNDLVPLEKLGKTLTSLNLSGTGVGYLNPLLRMSKLRTLDLRRCEKVSADDLEWLVKHLPDCKVLTDAPAKKPAPASPGGW